MGKLSITDFFQAVFKQLHGLNQIFINPDDADEKNDQRYGRYQNTQDSGVDHIENKKRIDSDISRIE